MTELSPFQTPETDSEYVPDPCDFCTQESQQRFRTIFENAAVGIALVALDGRFLMVNRRLSEIVGYSTQELEARTFHDITHADDLAADLAQRKRMLACGASSYSMEKRYIRKDGRPIWVNLTVGKVLKPDGSLDYFITMVEDIAKRKEAETSLKESEAALREREAELQLAQDAANLGRWAWDLRNGELSWTDRCKVVFGLPLDADVTYEMFLAALHPEDRARVDAGVKAAIQTQTDYDVEMRAVWPDGSVHWIASKGRVYFDAGAPSRMVGVAFDITARKKAEEMMSYALREVDHRSKNLLTVVHAILRQTARTATPADFAELVSERIRGLAASYDLLTGNAWNGVALLDLARSQLAHFKDALGSRVTLNGPAIELKASAAQAIGMAIHELATNAAKYGALSDDAGCVIVEWSLEQGRFIMSWVEREGPEVAAPARKGFGQTVLVRMAQDALGAEVSLDYRPPGAEWRLSCPAENAVSIAGS
jgi:PAS domain S-box-containing protein